MTRASSTQQHPFTMVIGSHYIAFNALSQTLRAGIRHAFWHDYDSRITHDDLDIPKAKIITAISLKVEVYGTLTWNHLRDLRISLEDLFALIYMSLFWPMLISLRHSTETSLFDYNHYTNAKKDHILDLVRAEMTERAQMVLEGLPSPWQDLWAAFREQTHKAILEAAAMRNAHNMPGQDSGGDEEIAVDADQGSESS